MKKRRRSSLSFVGPELGKHRTGKKKYYTIPELARLTGLSRRQIDYWTELKLIAPSLKNPDAHGGGKPASFYSTLEALKILVFSDVKQRGFSLAQIRQLNRNVAGNGVKLDEVGAYLITDGVTILYASSDNEVVDILKNNRQMLLVPIHEQIEKLKKVA
jgi:DNA-binding transcriptional MerR regulator